MELNLKELRKAARYSQQTLSNASGVSRESIARYELGLQVPTLESAARIASVLGCTVDDLLKDNTREETR